MFLIGHEELAVFSLFGNISKMYGMLLPLSPPAIPVFQN